MRGMRYQTHRLLIMAELNKTLGRGWKRANIADMTPTLQRHVANWLFDFHMYSHWFEIQSMGWWLIEPERGYFTLDGHLEAGKNPLLQFRVQRPDGGQDGWGWFANTASGS